LYFAAQLCGLTYQATQQRSSEGRSGRFDCEKCSAPVHSWSGGYGYINSQPIRPRTATDPKLNGCDLRSGDATFNAPKFRKLLAEAIRLQIAQYAAENDTPEPYKESLPNFLIAGWGLATSENNIYFSARRSVRVSRPARAAIEIEFAAGGRMRIGRAVDAVI